MECIFYSKFIGRNYLLFAGKILGCVIFKEIITVACLQWTLAEGIETCIYQKRHEEIQWFTKLSASSFSLLKAATTKPAYAYRVTHQKYTNPDQDQLIPLWIKALYNQNNKCLILQNQLLWIATSISSIDWMLRRWNYPSRVAWSM